MKENKEGLKMDLFMMMRNVMMLTRTMNGETMDSLYTLITLTTHKSTSNKPAQNISLIN